MNNGAAGETNYIQARENDKDTRIGLTDKSPHLHLTNVFFYVQLQMDKTLESQENFIEVARSRDVEVLESKQQWVSILFLIRTILSCRNSNRYHQFIVS